MTISAHISLPSAKSQLSAKEVGEVVSECTCAQEGVNWGGQSNGVYGKRTVDLEDITNNLPLWESELPFKPISYLIRDEIFSWLTKLPLPGKCSRHCSLLVHAQATPVSKPYQQIKDCSDLHT